eukprot:8015253-Heterocapsa_arctica.AAC.1
MGFSLALEKVLHGMPNQKLKADPAASLRSWRKVSWSAGLDRSRRSHGTSGECRLSDLSTATHTK